LRIENHVLGVIRWISPNCSRYYYFFILNLLSLSHQIHNIDQKQAPQSLSGRSGDAGNIDKKAIRVDVPDIVSVSACADLTLPPGAGLCIDTIHGPVYMVTIIFCVSKRIVVLHPNFKPYERQSVAH
jgi:hypothetical protein